MRYVILPLLGLLYTAWTVCAVHDLFNLKNESKWWLDENDRGLWVLVHGVILVIGLGALVRLYW